MWYSNANSKRVKMVEKQQTTRATNLQQISWSIFVLLCSSGAWIHFPHFSSACVVSVELAICLLVAVDAAHLLSSSCDFTRSTSSVFGQNRGTVFTRSCLYNRCSVWWTPLQIKKWGTSWRKDKWHIWLVCFWWGITDKFKGAKKQSKIVMVETCLELSLCFCEQFTLRYRGWTLQFRAKISLPPLRY